MRICLHLGNGWPKWARKFRQDEQLNVAKKALRIGLTSDDVISRDHCPVCGGGNLLQYEKLVFQEITIPYQRCGSCDLVFMNPVPNQAWHDRLYGHAFWETKSLEAADQEHQARQQQLIKELQRTDKLCATLDSVGCAPPASGRILEISCAFGLIISTIEKLNETIPAPEERIDLIVFSHVMENIVDLDIVFAAIDRWLAPNGVVLMETPNSTVQNSTHIYHPYCFSRASLQRLYRGHGYEILSIRSTGRPSSVLIPRYLTLTARRNTEVAAPGTRTYKSGGRRLGHCWRRTIRGTPLKYVDSMLTGLLYAPSDAVKRCAAELATAYDAAGEITQR